MLSAKTSHSKHSFATPCKASSSCALISKGKLPALNALKRSLRSFFAAKTRRYKGD